MNAMDMKTDFQRFEFSCGNTYGKDFKTIGILPSATIILDDQLDMSWIYTELDGSKTFYPSYKSFGILLDFLGFYIEIDINIKTNKSAENEKN